MMRGGEGRRGPKGDNSTVGTRGPVPGRYFGNRRSIINRKSRKPLTSETVRRLYAGYVAANHTLHRGRAPTDRQTILPYQENHAMREFRRHCNPGEIEYVNPSYVHKFFAMRTHLGEEHEARNAATFNPEYKKFTCRQIFIGELS